MSWNFRGFVTSFSATPSPRLYAWRCCFCDMTRPACRDAPWRVRHPRCILLLHAFAASATLATFPSSALSPRTRTRHGASLHTASVLPLTNSILCPQKHEKPSSRVREEGFMCMCPERESNPYGHHWPRDFKSLVATNSTIWAVCAANLRQNIETRKQEAGNYSLSSRFLQAGAFLPTALTPIP